MSEHTNAKNEIERTSLTHQDDFLTAMNSLVTGCRHSLIMLIDKLDDELFNPVTLSQNITRISRHAKARTDIRILIKSSEALARRYDPLPTLARKLPSIVQVRQLTTTPTDDHMNYAIGDRELLLLRFDSSVNHGFFSRIDQPQVRNLLDEFNHLWNLYSAPVDALREIHL